MDNKRDLSQFLAPICCLHLCKRGFWFQWFVSRNVRFVFTNVRWRGWQDSFKNLMTWVRFREPMWSGKERTGAWKLSDLHTPYLINNNTCKGIWVRIRTKECPELVLTIQYKGVGTVCYLLETWPAGFGKFAYWFIWISSLHDSWLVWNFLHRPGWSPTGSYSPASVFCV